MRWWAGNCASPALRQLVNDGRFDLTGEPSYTLDIRPASRNDGAILAAAGRIVNAIPGVVTAPTGIRTTIDMPLVTGRIVYGPQ